MSPPPLPDNLQYPIFPIILSYFTHEHGHSPLDECQPPDGYACACHDYCVHRSHTHVHLSDAGCSTVQHTWINKRL